MYEYRAYVTDVYDGDTITVDIDLGFKVHAKDIKVRMSGIDAPEIRGLSIESGRKSRDRLRELILNKHVIIKTKKDRTGKYGRWLARVMLNGTDINQMLVDEGLASVY